VNAKCVSWLKERILREQVVLDILAEVRQRVAQQTTDAGSEVGQLEEQATTLRREITNLAEAVALTKGSVTALAEKLAARQERLASTEARLQLLKAAPEVLSLEVRRLEVGVRKRVEQLREFLDRDPEEARKILDALLDGPMVFTPIATPEGKRYEVTGRIATGDVLRVLSDPQGARAEGADDPQSGRPQGDSESPIGFLALPSDFADLAPIHRELLKKRYAVSNPLVPSLTPSWCRVTAT
jgi:hypothetical protein